MPVTGAPEPPRAAVRSILGGEGAPQSLAPGDRRRIRLKGRHCAPFRFTQSVHTLRPSSTLPALAACAAKVRLACPLAARGSQDGPAQPCQHEGGSTKDLMVITRWMSYEAALLGTAEDLKSRGASLCMQVKAFMRIPSGSASLITCPPPCTRSYLSSHDTVDELVHKDS